ncbi:MAG TPA: hypothetical protein VLA46_05080 [Saprospiraceae bacterium]|nr:hypothetical protein [Saprospiraceae bacterium]
MTWTYIADDGVRYNVGLFHGDNTGHLLVYCNARIVVIDFSVLSSKNYSFFINDELCDLVIEEKDGKFLYGFKVDEVTDTARNRGRRKMIRTEVRQSLLIGFLFILIILLIGWLVFRFNS